MDIWESTLVLLLFYSAFQSICLVFEDVTCLNYYRLYRQTNGPWEIWAVKFVYSCPNSNTTVTNLFSLHYLSNGDISFLTYCIIPLYIRKYCTFYCIVVSMCFILVLGTLPSEKNCVIISCAFLLKCWFMIFSFKKWKKEQGLEILSLCFFIMTLGCATRKI